MTDDEGAVGGRRRLGGVGGFEVSFGLKTSSRRISTGEVRWRDGRVLERDS